MTTRADCHLALTHFGRLPCLVVSGALRSSLAEALGSRKFSSTSRRLIVDLRAVELADSVGAQALARFLPSERAACILPGHWCAGRRLLVHALRDFPLHASSTELSGTASLADESPMIPRRHLRKAVRIPGRLLSQAADQAVTIFDVSLGGASFERALDLGGEGQGPLPGEKIQLDIAGTRIAARILRMALPGRIGVAFTRSRQTLPALPAPLAV